MGPEQRAIIDAAVETHVDTVAALLKAGADPKLNALIFGESVLNDAVAIVLVV